MVVGALLLATATEAALPSVVVLNRALPLKGVSLLELRELDRARHARTGAGAARLSSWATTVVSGEGQSNGPVVSGEGQGPGRESSTPWSAARRCGGHGHGAAAASGEEARRRLYYTSVELGNPSKRYTFDIDTGSSISWIACKGCRGCSTKKLYNPNSSSTSSRISCWDHSCKTCRPIRVWSLPNPSGMCGYDLSYGDQTRAIGYYVSDIMHFDTITGNCTSANSSAPVVFRCTNSLSNFMATTDGILGFGQGPLSVISQLHSQGISPKSFPHCLEGSEEGGGILVLGKIVAPELVYTPLVPSQFTRDSCGLRNNTSIHR
ncbi:hypothetical protein ACQ4PT_012967 [Festuca glaucescens]